MYDTKKLRRCSSPEDVKLGETVIYHEGMLAVDRDRREMVSSNKKTDAPLTNEAASINNVAEAFFRKSTAIVDLEENIRGSKEFALFQLHLGYNEKRKRNEYAYAAKRIAV